MDIEFIPEEPSKLFRYCRCDTWTACMAALIVMTLSLSNLAMPLFYSELLTGCHYGIHGHDDDFHKKLRQIHAIAIILSAVLIEGPAFVWLYAQATGPPRSGAGVGVGIFRGVMVSWESQDSKN